MKNSFEFRVPRFVFWVSSFLLSFILSFGLSFWGSRLCPTRNSNPETRNQQIETRNTELERQCDSLQTIVRRLSQESDAQRSIIDSLYTLLDQNALEINQNRTYHENEITRINAMPDSSLYRFFTEYIK